MERNKGFTLIELLIATVIIGLLAIIVLPRFNSTREKAYDAAAIAEIKSLTSMAEAYYADYLVYPNRESDLGYTPPPRIVITRFNEETTNGHSVVHIHLHHDGSSNYFHVEYPEEDIVKRKR